MNQPQFTDVVVRKICCSSYDTERQKFHTKTKLLKVKIIRILKVEGKVLSIENYTRIYFQKQFPNAATEFLRQFCILK